jgi:hypothetical protein
MPYLDPTRTIVSPNRKITAFTNSYNGENTSYQTVNGSIVPGNGSTSSVTQDDLTIATLPVPTTEVTQPTCSILTEI